MNIEEYLPVPWEFRETLQWAQEIRKEGSIYYFDFKDRIEAATGIIKSIMEEKGNGEFLITSDGDKVRLDRIVTLYGKPGPSFDKYDGYANACLDCSGGYDL